ncbi:3-oxoacyl-[acyl-carrier-protein] synthase III C-terminal domain-containing protein [Leisingera thetidis]|uniref:3-oxoacyl-[acyl-carrier-protein] synthase III C-terminal domain-containing protein n=1 Tax=Leisingera thetidis TaxID=2930199 RepID=UPI0021F773F5|nr:3-oxoacyl-[acyl-carrier-protein] synthase III C-terminal domain-containing protein [Leisingera thetidis]
MKGRRQANGADGLAIRAMAAAVPDKVQTVAQASGDLGLNAMQVKMFSRLYGLNRLPFDPEQSLGGLLQAALDALAAKAPDDVANARYVLHCHTIPMVRPPADGLGLNLEAAEDISVTMAHCASGLVALDMLQTLLAPGETAVVLVGEKAFHPRVRVIRDNTLMSDGVAALLVGKGSGRWQVLGTHSTHDGAYALSRGHPREEPGLTADYVGFVVSHIHSALQRFGCSVAALRMILPHNVNMISWQAIAKALGVPNAAVYTRNIPRFGHCFGADPFLNLMDADADGQLAPGDKALCVSVGMGMTAASSLIEIPPLTPAASPLNTTI